MVASFFVFCQNEMEEVLIIIQAFLNQDEKNITATRVKDKVKIRIAIIARPPQLVRP